MSNEQLPVSNFFQSLRFRKNWIRPAIYAGIIAFIALLPVSNPSPYLLDMLCTCFVSSVAAVSLRTITISGQIPLAHGAFMGIGAYAAGMASKWLDWPGWITIPTGALVAMGIGILISYPFSRLRSLYYAMISLFFGIGAMLIISAGGVWTGSYQGLSGIHSLFTSKISYYYFFLVLALICIIALYRFEFSRIGTTLKAISQSYLVASSVGINEAFYRIMAVAVGCFFVGLIGAAYIHYQTVLNVHSYSLTATLWLFMYVLIGGIGSFVGPIIGTFVLILIPQYFFDLKTFSPYISAALLLIVVYLMPHGIAGIPELVKSWVAKYRKE